MKEATTPSPSPNNAEAPGSPPLADALEPTVASALQRAMDRLAECQEDDGSWWGDYSGPMFLLPMYVALCHITGKEIAPEKREAMRREFHSALQSDSGIGLHREGPPCLFTTTLGYVSLRLLGEPPDTVEIRHMRRWIHENGTPHGAAPWGKWILCLLGLYDYRGLNPILPELWLLPRWFPLHPGRLWCHCRMVYLPQSLLYASRAKIEPDDLIRQLRSELFKEDWETIRFARFRNFIAPSDNLFPPKLPVRIANGLLSLAERFLPKVFRQKALEEVRKQIEFEESVTSGIAIGPVNRVLNTLCHFFSDPESEKFENGFQATSDYLWEAGDRCVMQGYNHSKLWDSAFATQAILAAGGAESHSEMLAGAYRYLGDHQVQEDVPNRQAHYRDTSRGGWPFSDSQHGWPISDCTAEGFKCAVTLAELDPAQAIPNDRLEDAIHLLLGMQNPDGGWPTYEKRRAGDWMEWFNPSGIFGRIMVDYSYPECTSAALQALAKAQAVFPEYEPKQVARAMKRGELYLRRQQREDGSWEGSWAVCFTYGTWFGVTGLRAAGASPDDPALRKAVQFLRSRQQDNGSWGEEISSCLERRWVERPGGHVVQTSWALLALLEAGDEDSQAHERAIQFLLQNQSANGEWPDQGMVGMFNRTCAIHYDWYRLYFPLWALAKWSGFRPTSS